ncbi:MAG: flagellar M-ring protein FliF [Desulfobacterales bacterium]|nr:MAG: flagellar M-ring protein FliF [Desulfobacterales bacterium]
MAVQEQTVEVTQKNEIQEPAALERKNFVQTLRKWPLSRKIATGVVLVVSIIVFAALIIQGKNANQQLLYANLPANDASEVVTWLKNQKIDYTLKNGGKDIWIPAEQIYQSRLDLAAKGLPSGGGVGFEVFDKQSFALTDYVQKVNYTRALQGELARTITSLAPVESTRVHLALPEKRVFRNQQKKPTASVIVTLVPGKQLDEQQVKGILHLVAGSISGMEPENVKLIDSNGMVLEPEKEKDDSQLVSADMLAFQQEVEHRMEMRVQDLLDKTMGRDNAMVRISATLDFSKVEKTEELFDSEEPVIRSEQINSETSVAEAVGGIPGVESNLQGNELGGGETGPGTSKNSRTTNYEISKTISKIVNPVGTITKLSVSVLVADSVQPGEEGQPSTTKPRTPAELQSIEAMVSTALGIDIERGDQINVTSMPFVADPGLLQPEDIENTDSLYQYLPFVKYGLIAVGMLLLYFFLIRPVVKTMKGEIKEHYKTVKQLELEQLKQLQEPERQKEPVEPPEPLEDMLTTLRKEVMQNHIPTAFILKNWIQEG